jgi:hypothetical protein
MLPCYEPKVCGCLDITLSINTSALIANAFDGQLKVLSRAILSYSRSKLLEALKFHRLHHEISCQYITY